MYEVPGRSSERTKLTTTIIAVSMKEGIRVVVGAEAGRHTTIEDRKL